MCELVYVRVCWILTPIETKRRIETEGVSGVKAFAMRYNNAGLWIGILCAVELLRQRNLVNACTFYKMLYTAL